MFSRFRPKRALVLAAAALVGLVAAAGVGGVTRPASVIAGDHQNSTQTALYVNSSGQTSATITVGQSVTLIAVVSPGSPGQSPTCPTGGGQVAFYQNNNTPVGTQNLSGNIASLTQTPVTPGTYTYSATYTGSIFCASSTSNNVTVTVLPASGGGGPVSAPTSGGGPVLVPTSGGGLVLVPTISVIARFAPTISVTATPGAGNTFIVGNTYTVTVTTTGVGGCVPTGTVSLTAGGGGPVNPLSVPVSSAGGGGTFNPPSVPVSSSGATSAFTPTQTGTITITATYGGNPFCGSASGSTQITVQAAPTTTQLTSNPASGFTVGSTFTLTATVNAGTGCTLVPGTDTVTFSVVSGPGTLTGLPSGSQTLSNSVIVSSPTISLSTGSQTLTISGGVIAESLTTGNLTPTAPGTYVVQAQYNGNSTCAPSNAQLTIIVQSDQPAAITATGSHGTNGTGSIVLYEVDVTVTGAANGCQPQTTDTITVSSATLGGSFTQFGSTTSGTNGISATFYFVSTNSTGVSDVAVQYTPGSGNTTCASTSLTGQSA